MPARSLLVVLYGRVIGRIEQRSAFAEPAFTYDAAYVESGSTPLGTGLPIADIMYRGRYVQAFLEGILPEDPGTRQQWARALDVEPGDTVAMLSRMGWDCPGAVQFCLPEELDELRSRGTEVRPVDEEGIAYRLAALRTGSETSWTLPDEHWSLPGQQSKIALLKTRDGWYETLGSAATTHILKPGIGRLHHQALVEHATMCAARTLGVEVARTEYVRFGAGEPAIVIERYDRLRLADGTVMRLHQEDFCSAGGRLPAKKYEADGGLGLSGFARIVAQNVDDQAHGMRAIGDFAAFNYIAGAPDGHSKNISLMLLPGETRVAPLYDLATSLPYGGKNPALREVAVSIGGRRKFGQVLSKHWDRAAATLGIPADDFRDRARYMAETFPDAFSDALTEVDGEEAAEVRSRSIDAIAGHAQNVVARLRDRAE